MAGPADPDVLEILCFCCLCRRVPRIADSSLHPGLSWLRLALAGNVYIINGGLFLRFGLPDNAAHASGNSSGLLTGMTSNILEQRPMPPTARQVLHSTIRRTLLARPGACCSRFDRGRQSVAVLPPRMIFHILIHRNCGIRNEHFSAVRGNAEGWRAENHQAGWGQSRLKLLV